MGTYSASKLFSLCKPFLGLLVCLFVCFILSSDFTNIADCCKKRKADIENYCKSNFSM